VRSYELVFIVNPELDEDDLTAVRERVEGLIERSSGKVTKVEPSAGLSRAKAGGRPVCVDAA
jgi:ribosomal protein S6